MRERQPDLNRQLLAAWERLWLDPDWDTVTGYRNKRDEKDDQAPEGYREGPPSP